MTTENRNFTDADIKALVDEFMNQWYSFIGKKFMLAVCVGIFVLLMGIAAIGYKSH